MEFPDEGDDAAADPDRHVEVLPDFPTSRSQFCRFVNRVWLQVVGFPTEANKGGQIVQL